MSDDEKRESYLAAPWHKSARHHCFGCSRSNPAGLALQMRESNDRLVCDFTLTRLHESYPGLIHGGVSAAVLDELMGNVLVHRERKVCFTAGLRLIYLGALRIEHPYRAIAWLHQRPTDVTTPYDMRGEVRDADDNVLVTARATFQWMTVEMWRRAVSGDESAVADLLPFLRNDT